MKKILIIGGGGYIGSRLLEDYSSKYLTDSIDICWFTEGNSIDFNNLSKDYYQKYDVILLLSGHSSVKMCEGDPKSSYLNNVRNFINLIGKLNKNQKFIYASSSSVYGNVGIAEVDETYLNFLPHNHYDITKHIIDLYAPLYDVEYYGLRFGTVNGYSKNLRTDIMINSMVYSSLKHKKINLYVKDIVRPILGIKDLSLAISSIIDSPEDNRGIYNLASFNSTAETIAKTISKILNVPIDEQNINEVKNIFNSKLQTKCYNFSIDCNKFIKTYDFNFTETIESITKELVDNFDKMNFSLRNENKNYE